MLIGWLQYGCSPLSNHKKWIKTHKTVMEKEEQMEQVDYKDKA